MKRVAAIALLATIALAISACGAGPTATPTLPSTPPVTPTSSGEDPVTAGYALFWDKGCATCHGANAEGRLGPSLTSESRNVIINKVRYSSPKTSTTSRET